MYEYQFWIINCYVINHRIFVCEWKSINYLGYVNSMHIIYCKIFVMVEQYLIHSKRINNYKLDQCRTIPLVIKGRLGYNSKITSGQSLQNWIEITLLQ